jgi:hypothetical protein
MVAPQLAILAVIRPLESSRILGSAAIDADEREGTLLRLGGRGSMACGRAKRLSVFLLLFYPWVGFYLSERTHFQVSS